MNKHERSWQRLATLARLAPGADEVVVAPPGFARRVAAQWLAARRPVREGSVWEWLSVRSLVVASIVMVVSALSVLPVFNDASAGELADLADPLSAEFLPPS